MHKLVFQPFHSINLTQNHYQDLVDEFVTWSRVSKYLHSTTYFMIFVLVVPRSKQLS